MRNVMHKLIELKACPICRKDVSLKQMSDSNADIFFMITRSNDKDKSCTCRLFMESDIVSKYAECEQKEKAKHDLVKKWNTRDESKAGAVPVIKSVVYSNKQNKYDYSSFTCHMSDGTSKDFQHPVSTPIPKEYVIEGQTWEWLCGFMNGMWRQAIQENKKIEYIKETDEESTTTHSWWTHREIETCKSLFHDGKTHDEIAKSLGRTEASVRNLLLCERC